MLPPARSPSTWAFSRIVPPSRLRRPSTAIAARTRWTRWNATLWPLVSTSSIGSGVFFKALANYQWDLLLETDIVSKEYLDGCYDLGQRYPDLCASIFLLCERGE